MEDPDIIKTNNKKKHDCTSFIEFSVSRDNQGFSIVNFKRANWEHNHPLDQLFLEANGIISN